MKGRQPSPHPAGALSVQIYRQPKKRLDRLKVHLIGLDASCHCVDVIQSFQQALSGHQFKFVFLPFHVTVVLNRRGETVGLKIIC